VEKKVTRRSGVVKLEERLKTIVNYNGISAVFYGNKLTATGLIEGCIYQKVVKVSARTHQARLTGRDAQRSPSRSLAQMIVERIPIQHMQG
jgi:hypothetical protein